MSDVKVNNETVVYCGEKYLCTGTLTPHHKAPSIATDIPEWSENAAYVGDSTVRYKGKIYKAKWWTQGDYPDCSQEWKQVEPVSSESEPAAPVAVPDSAAQTSDRSPVESLITGYLSSWGPRITFTDAVKEGYNCIVLAFGAVNGTEVSLPAGHFALNQVLKDDIATAKAKGARQILFSVGGEHNTYNPGGCNPQELARSIVTLLKEYGFTGIDFDLEINTDDRHLDKVCACIKEIDPSFIITAAPQINQGVPHGDLYLVSTGHFRIYDIAIRNNRFDYLFVQNYNNPAPKLEGVGEKNPDFISKSFYSLKKSVPSETLISIGLPASRTAAGPTNVFYDSASAEVYQRVLEQYKQISQDPQYGGAMTWSINQDFETGYKFVRNLL